MIDTERLGRILHSLNEITDSVADIQGEIRASIGNPIKVPDLPPEPPVSTPNWPDAINTYDPRHRPPSFDHNGEIGVTQTMSNGIRVTPLAAGKNVQVGYMTHQPFSFDQGLVVLSWGQVFNTQTYKQVGSTIGYSGVRFSHSQNRLWRQQSGKLVMQEFDPGTFEIKRTETVALDGKSISIDTFDGKGSIAPFTRHFTVDDGDRVRVLKLDILGDGVVADEIWSRPRKTWPSINGMRLSHDGRWLVVTPITNGTEFLLYDLYDDTGPVHVPPSPVRVDHADWYVEDGANLFIQVTPKDNVIFDPLEKQSYICPFIHDNGGRFHSNGHVSGQAYQWRGWVLNSFDDKNKLTWTRPIRKSLPNVTVQYGKAKLTAPRTKYEMIDLITIKPPRSGSLEAVPSPDGKKILANAALGSGDGVVLIQEPI